MRIAPTPIVIRSGWIANRFDTKPLNAPTTAAIRSRSPAANTNGQRAGAGQLADEDIRHADDRRNRQIQASEQGCECLPGAGQAHERGEDEDRGDAPPAAGPRNDRDRHEIDHDHGGQLQPGQIAAAPDDRRDKTLWLRGRSGGHAPPRRIPAPAVNREPMMRLTTRIVP